MQAERMILFCVFFDQNMGGFSKTQGSHPMEHDLLKYGDIIKPSFERFTENRANLSLIPYSLLFGFSVRHVWSLLLSDRFIQSLQGIL